MKKIVSLLLCFVMAYGMCACGGSHPNSGNSGGGDSLSGPPDKSELDLSGKLIIKSMNKGYGTSALEAIADAYMKENQEATIQIKPEGDIPSVVANELGLGADKNDTEHLFRCKYQFCGILYGHDDE